MKIAYVHENWKAGAARCVDDLQAIFAATDEVLRVPSGADATPDSIWAQLRAFAPDVVHCHSFYGNQSLLYSDLARLTALAPTIFTVHDPRPIGIFHEQCWDCPHYHSCIRCPLATPTARVFPPLNTFFRTRLKKRLTHFRARSTLQIVSPSLWLKRRLEASELGRFRHTHLPNGVDLKAYHPAVPPHPFRAALPAHAPVVLHVAHSVGLQINGRKGLDDLWAAFSDIVLPQLPAARLAIVGEGAVPNHPAVIALGKVEPHELPPYYTAADLYVTATRADNLPYTVMEAMACGRAVIGTRTGGVPEMIAEGATGVVVPPRAPDALGRAIVDLLRRPERLRAYGQAARQIAERDYGLELFGQRYRQLYEKAGQAGGAAVA